ncbi:nuclease-related domain-containing protein [Nonomuraea turcica]|uniref:nuclease-related domain-containing protein n=1 Tax=Nonomuraea sp. G32 TaxID=3067274 RepID=UPI00273CB55B|nr:nuclease-related domain-containing protein [Nonomuraea sp. G32]MDP4511842.1 nuclease-related domain-containing protein [Nonomuraea sp. G32]
MTIPQPANTSKAGASAQAAYRTRLDATRTRRWTIRAALSLLAGVVVWWLLGWQAALVTAAAVAATDFLHHWRRHSSTTAWRKGAAGERATARRLRSLELAGYTVLHDRAVPRSRANIDHLVIGPTGVFVVDSKKWDRRTTIRSGGGALWVGRTPIDKITRSVAFEARAVSEALRYAMGRPVDVVTVIAVHGARMPRWGAINAGGTTLLRASRLRGWIARHPRQYTADQVATFAAAAEQALPAYVPK